MKSPAFNRIDNPENVIYASRVEICRELKQCNVVLQLFKKAPETNYCTYVQVELGIMQSKVTRVSLRLFPSRSKHAAQH
jgi:hypothetical protein